MGKLGNGPDMQDISALWWEIEKNHNCTITMLVELDGTLGGSGLYVSGISLRKRPVMLEEGALGCASVRWPHRDHQTFEGALFKLLYELERLTGGELVVKES